MTLESSLPYLSVAAALAAAFSEGRQGAVLRTVAVGALAGFAYLRWIAPSEAALALTLNAWGQALGRPAPARRRAGTGFAAAGWLVLAFLFAKAGDGRAAFLEDAGKAALLAALLVGAGLLLRRRWRAMPAPRPLTGAAMLAATVMTAAALSLDWAFWPAMAGSGAILAGESVRLPTAADATPRRWRAPAAWALEFAGLAAVAYAFLR